MSRFNGLRASDIKEIKRKEAEERNAAYQKLSLEEKKARNSTKVIKKLEQGEEK